jgi:hypothetical protein
MAGPVSVGREASAGPAGWSRVGMGFGRKAKTTAGNRRAERRAPPAETRFGRPLTTGCETQLCPGSRAPNLLAGIY